MPESRRFVRRGLKLLERRSFTGFIGEEVARLGRIGRFVRAYAEAYTV